MSIDIGSLVAFEQVAAGHDGIMSDEAGAVIVKPCTEAEVAFYEASIADHPDFARLMPTFMGTLRQGRSEQADVLLAFQDQDVAMAPSHGEATNDSKDAAADLEKTHASRGRKLQTDTLLVLENVLAGFKRPNFVDIKMGKRLWADGAAPAKRTKLDGVASTTTSGSIGFRIAGMRTWEPDHTSLGLGHDQDTFVDPPKGNYRVFDKAYGRGLTSDTVKDALRILFCVDSDYEAQDSISDIISSAADSVEEIESIITNQESRMYSASLLMVYEGDPTVRRAAIQQALAQTKQSYESDVTAGGSDRGVVAVSPEAEGDVDTDEEDEDAEEGKLFDVRVIDFAHAAWTPGEGPDENVLVGLRNLRRIMRGLLS